MERPERRMKKVKETNGDDDDDWLHRVASRDLS
jgi:hypothetical protein